MNKILDYYEQMYQYNRCTKHYTHDGVFYISNESELGFKVIRFYDNDYRVLGHYSSLAEAYTETVLT